MRQNQPSVEISILMKFSPVGFREQSLPAAGRIQVGYMAQQAALPSTRVYLL